MTDLSQAIAMPDQPIAIFEAVETLVDKTIGIKLFTIMEIDNNKALAKRSYTNNPKAYPIAGEKPLHINAWSEHVLTRHQIFVANRIEDIADVFPDYDHIQSLGCESCLNLPIVVGDKVIGTLNCLHEAGHYTPERVEAAKSLRNPGALALLVAKLFNKGDVHV